MNQCASILSFCLTLFIGVLSQDSWAGQEPGNTRSRFFSEANIFFELNNTDGDLGIHARVDGESWDNLKIVGPNDHRILKIRVEGQLQKQGLTEIFFESAEPSFDQLLPVNFFRRFPAGKYFISGVTLDGERLESNVELTHVMPAPPEPTVNGLEINKNSTGNATVVRNLPVTIKWPRVTMSHPDVNGGGAGVQPPIPIIIHNYEIAIEVENIDTPFKSVIRALLEPDVTSFTIPEEFISLGNRFRYEVLAREVSFNQTATESCFVLKIE